MHELLDVGIVGIWGMLGWRKAGGRREGVVGVRGGGGSTPIRDCRVFVAFANKLHKRSVQKPHDRLLKSKFAWRFSKVSATEWI